MGRETPANDAGLQATAMEPTDPSACRARDETSADLGGFGGEKSHRIHFRFRSAEFWHTTTIERQSNEIDM